MSSLWLPLNGDLHNQGISGIIVTGTNVSINTAGKIGSCYSFNGSSSYIELNSALCSNETTEFSYACWVKFNSTASCCLFSNRTAVDSNGVTLFVNNNGNILFDIGKERHTKAYTFSTGTWYHLAFTYKKGATKKIYVNGAEIYSAGTSGTMTSAAATKSFIGASQNTSTTVNDNYLNGYLNDVRIWNDHALSAAEVHEIAQGLVLHYKLDDTYAETTTNLYSGTFSNTCYNGATGKYGYGTTTDIYKTTENFQGKESVKVYMGTAGLSAYPYIYFDAFNTAGTAVHTLSFDYYPTSQTSIIPYSYNGTYNISYKTNNGAHDSKTNISSITIPVITNQWNHISITMQKYDTTNTSRGNGYIRIGSASHTSTTTDYWLFANIQIEAKDHETGYTFPGTTRTSTNIQDSSGYGHNATLTNGSLATANTARYSTALSLGSSTKAIGNPIFEAGTFISEYTWTGWINRNYTNTTSKQIHANIANVGLYTDFTPYFSWTSGKTDGTTTGNGAAGGTAIAKLNEWTHMAITYKSGIGKFYINGELTRTFNYSSYGVYIAAAANNTLGNGFIGNLSDIRIYVTQLLDTDIKLLYNIGMRVDNLQNIHTFELNENGTNKLTKTGILYDNIIEPYLTLPDGSNWKLLLYHYVDNGNNLFTKTNATYCNDFGLYSRLKDINNYTYDSKYEYYVIQDGKEFRWTQTSSPTATSITGLTTVSGYNNPVNGLAKPSSLTQTYIGYNAWWGACGCWTKYSTGGKTGIPGFGSHNANGMCTKYLALYTRIDKPHASLIDLSSEANEFIER